MEKLLAETFGDNEEVMDVVNYIASVLKINQAIIRGLATEDSEIKGINPLELQTMRRYENGMVTNRFYQENFALIKAGVALYEIKVKTAGMLMSYNESDKNKRDTYFYKHIRAVFLTALDIFTTVALLYKGIEFAEKFDTQLRSAYQLDPRFEEWLDSKEG